MARLLIIDDEKNMRWALSRALRSEGLEIFTAGSGPEGLALLREEKPDLVLLDLKLPGLDGLSVLRQIKAEMPLVAVIIMTAYGSIETAVEAIKAGAYDYITKPFDLEAVKLVLARALENQSLTKEVAYLRRELETRYSFQNIVGKSAKMRQVFDLIERVADSQATVLIQGESGTGKELVARALHYLSGRRTGPFIAVSCAALPETLLESELFGHEKGAFTGALTRRIGRFEMANGGTLFLDEVGELTPAVQVKLLRVLQERSFERLGGTERIMVDVRIIAATNRNLEQAMREGRFRQDLYYRLNVVPITLPPLRERKEDIPLLVQHFLAKFSRTNPPSNGLAPPGGAAPSGGHFQIAPAALAALMNYSWPGNVRELENVLERACLLCSGGVITRECLPAEILAAEEGGGSGFTLDIPEEGLDLEELEKHLILKALEKSGGNQSQAARLLHLSRYALLYRLEKYGLKKTEKPDSPM
ncbi:MAG: sigma-54 dependent transcriptional regulator [Firmicutes bacterium]|nr:sigma-54 dependent transcriptional regulator [Bacillota bacterium]MCL5039907.1 sigma-54 dependent transcriptional regulator [Bacillota bacterium]